MNGPIGGAVGPTTSRPAPLDEDAALRRACAQLEGVFFEQVLRAMRETIPEGGLVDGGLGEDMFTAMMDAHLAEIAAGRMNGSIASALYRQLRGGSQ